MREFIRDEDLEVVCIAESYMMNPEKIVELIDFKVLLRKKGQKDLNITEHISHKTYWDLYQEYIDTCVS